MTQFLKDHIRDAIIDATLHEFAMRGFLGANMAGIARRSGISTGNLYRYFTNKAELFATVVPSPFVQLYLKKIRTRIAAYPIGIRPENIPVDSTYLKLSEELLEFTIANRLRVLILLEGAAGTAYESFASKLQTEWTKRAIDNFNLAKIADNSRVVYALLEDLYGNFIRALGSILRRFSDTADIRAAVRILTNYHLGGLSMLTR